MEGNMKETTGIEHPVLVEERSRRAGFSQRLASNCPVISAEY